LLQARLKTLKCIGRVEELRMLDVLIHGGTDADQ